MNYFKKLRVSSGSSQRDVANKLGYSTPQFISNWERSQSLPPKAVLKTLAKLYKCGVSDLEMYCFNFEVDKLAKHWNREILSIGTRVK